MRARAKLRLIVSACFVLLFCFTRQSTLAAQGDENWDGNFGVPGANDLVGPIALTGKDVYVAGRFTVIGGVPANHIARWDGTNWHALGPGISGGVPYTRIPALAVCSNELYAAGAFSQVGSVPVNNIGKWDGTNWLALGDGILGEGIDTAVSALAVIGTDLYVAGKFDRAGGFPATNIAKWNGTNWTDVGGGLNGWVVTLVVKDDELYAGGNFSQAGSVPVRYVAKWDRTKWSAVGNPDSAPPSALRVAGSDLYLYAPRSEELEENRFSLIEWIGSNWVDVASGTFSFNCFDCRTATFDLAINGNNFYISGSFISAVNGVSAPGIAKWDGTTWSSLGQGLKGGAFSIAPNGSELFVVGSFSQAGGKPSTNIALWHIPHTLSASRSGDVLTLSWPATGTNFVLEATDTLPPTNWVEIYDAPVLAGDQLIVTNSISSTTRYYRLRRR